MPGWWRKSSLEVDLEAEEAVFLAADDNDAGVAEVIDEGVTAGTYGV
jgi:hypothetical protein